MRANSGVTLAGSWARRAWVHVPDKWLGSRESRADFLHRLRAVLQRSGRMRVVNRLWVAG